MSEDTVDKLFNKIAEKGLKIVDKLLDKVDKAMDDDEELGEKLKKWAEENVTITVDKKEK